MELPCLPTGVADFIPYLSKNSDKDTWNAVEPYKQYESKLRELYAQEPANPVLRTDHVNTVPIFVGNEHALKIRARDLNQETQEHQDKYLLPLSDKDRKAHGSPAIVSSLKEFRGNFNLFSESSLVDLDWDNVVAAGSSVLAALLPVPSPHNESKRALRAYYHETLAPASDVDLFLYDLTETQAVEKIKQIEAKIRDSILTETTTVRTKHAITVVSQYPTRHIQIVLRLYKSIDEILTGFDVDSSCVAYDGTQVWASPRAVTAFVTQINTVDLTRRSPSYENRLAKYAKRGFEIWWPNLDRSRIDPTIFERSFSRVQGLARLLVLEKLPHPSDRDQYMAQRRAERGRPALPWNARYCHQLPGNVKNSDPDDVAEWVEGNEFSNYHTFTIPYGPKYTAKKIEKLLFTKDLLLNAEWNRPRGRETNLHRHPWFFGSVHDIIHDCCGFCPRPTTDEDLAALEEEGNLYVSGDIEFLTENPGRQAIGSFHPITNDDFTEMAYVGNTARLCQAIVDNDLKHVRDWCRQTDADVNRRDHVGRTPLHLAAISSSPEVLQCLIDHGARIVARVVDGMTALHMAAYRGDAQMVKALLLKSEENEEAEEQKAKLKKEARRQATRTKLDAVDADTESTEGDVVDLDDESLLEDNESQDSDRMTDGSFVKVEPEKQVGIDLPEDKNDPDVYNVDVLSWDSPVSPLHLAIMAGQVEVIELLIDSFGADVLLPVRIMDDKNRRRPLAAILTIVLALKLPLQEASRTITTLLRHGARSTQADMDHVTALHYVVNASKSAILDLLLEHDGPAAKQAVNHLVLSGWQYGVEVTTPLLTAILRTSQETADRLIAAGAKVHIEFEAFSKAFDRQFEHAFTDPGATMKAYGKSFDQPIIQAVRQDMTELVGYMIESGVDVNTLPRGAFEKLEHPTSTNLGEAKSLLDLVQDKLKALKEYVGQIPGNAPPKAPERLENDEVYLHEYPKGSYRQWLAERDLAQAKSIKYERQTKDYVNAMESGKRQMTDGEPEKLGVVRALIRKHQVLEATLLEKGAKTFCQLHPQIENLQQGTARYSGHAASTFGSSHNGVYKNDQRFFVPGLTAAKTEAYFLLYEAVWNGDVETVKSMTMSHHGKEDQPPLQIAVQDLRGFSPFSIAVLRGYTDLARAIMEIAHAQYEPEKRTEKYVYRMEADSDDGSGTSNEDDIKIYGELLDDEFTIDDVAALGRTIKSKISPMQVLNWQAEMWRTSHLSEKAAKDMYMHSIISNYSYFGREPLESWAWFHSAFEQECRWCRASLFRYAIAENKMQTLKILLQIGSEWISRSGKQDASDMFSVSAEDLDYAIRLGRVEMIGEIIKSTGASIPLQKLVQKSGVVVAEKPKYYQGLTVHGKKRKDWAEAGRGTAGRKPAEGVHAPLLRVIFEGNLESTEYFLTDAPLRRYLDFARAHKNDKQIQTLSKAAGGIEKSLKTWLTARSHLAIHMAVMARPRNDGSNPVLDFLIKTMPDAVDATSVDGTTPLQLAFKLQRYHDAKKLIDAGANQATRNLKGENLLHTITKSGFAYESGEALQALLGLLDQKLIPSMLLEHCGGTKPGSLTPLALAISPGIEHPKCQIFTLAIFLKYSQGKDLEMMDGAGDYPLHVLVRTEKTNLARYVIEYNPALLYRENAVGMTPLDVVQSTHLRQRIVNPPSLIKVDYYRYETAANSGILKKASRDFIKKDERDLQSMFDMCKEMAAARPGKRHLVSLLDANEVAKRLAIQQRKKLEDQATRANYTPAHQAKDLEDSEPSDEVAQWSFKADGLPKLDLKKFKREQVESQLHGNRQVTSDSESEK